MEERIRFGQKIAPSRHPNHIRRYVVQLAIEHEGCRLYKLPPFCGVERFFRGVDDEWVDALYRGYARRGVGEVNAKYKLIFVAVDRDDHVLGVTGATPKKGEPIKLMKTG